MLFRNDGNYCNLVLYDLTRYLRIFIKTIDRTEPMISVRDDDLSIDCVSYEEEWREGKIFFDLILVLLHM